MTGASLFEPTQGTPGSLLVMLVLFAAVSLPLPVQANSHGMEPALSPAEPGALDALEALGVDPGPAGRNSGFLDPDTAFALSIEARDAYAIVLRWKLADSYYLYRDRFGFSVSSGGVELDVPRLPPGTDKQDPYFGDTRVYYSAVEIVLPVKHRTPRATQARLEIHYQGCTDRGLCYTPMTKSVTLALPSVE